MFSWQQVNMNFFNIVLILKICDNSLRTKSYWFIGCFSFPFYIFRPLSRPFFFLFFSFIIIIIIFFFLALEFLLFLFCFSIFQKYVGRIRAATELTEEGGGAVAEQAVDLHFSFQPSNFIFFFSSLFDFLWVLYSKKKEKIYINT